MTFFVKRVYEAASERDGTRVLVDRLWPRGITKARAALHLWLKEIAPSPTLRSWFAHDPERFAEFRELYERELAVNPRLTELREMGRAHRVTLVYAARDTTVNHAVILLDYLTMKSSSGT